MAYDELQRRQDALARNRENHGRMASASTEFYTTGVGTYEAEEPVDFGLIFVEKPRPHYCTEIDTTALRELMDIDEGDPVDLPNCSGAVLDWDIDDNGYYVGAWCAMTISSAYLAVDVDLASLIEVTHHFDFHGTGLKMLPEDPTD